MQAPQPLPMSLQQFVHQQPTLLSEHLVDPTERIGCLEHFSRERPTGAATTPRRPRTPGTFLLPSAVRQPRPSGPQPGGARRRATLAGAGQAAQDGGGERRRGALGGRPREGRLGKAGGRDANGMANAQRCETHLHCAHVAPEATRDGVSLSDPIERCLARTSRGNRRRVGRELQMAENLADHLGLGDGGDNAQRSLTAKGTRGHIQSKHMPQEPGPAPGRCASLRLLPLHTLLARRRGNRLSQCAVRRQTAGIADKVDAR